LELWNPLMFATGVCGLLLVWFLPWFLISFPVLLALYLTPSLAYVNLRNQKVSKERRVLTDRHLKSLARRYLRLRFAPDEEKDDDRGQPINFIGKSFNQSEEDPSRVARAESSKGYKAALEMVYEALKLRATDIHMEPSRNQMAVRFRID